jgi:hypothetical protein
MWFNESPDNRILSWRAWRDKLEEKSLDEVAEIVAADWAKVPTVMHYLAPDQISDWPNPWQLITDSLYCNLSIALGMYYSLALLDHPRITDLRLQVYKIPEGWLNLSSINQGKYVLNYNHGKVVNTSQLSISQENLRFEYLNIDLCSKFK